ncbi:protein with protein kinase II-like association domain [Nostoc sp. PCC 7524]|uniref:YybH family protein n=1 Tax=Nostoc sp. (strain ATCC 29411 / PCC 7524) TaxID=28072 RepID=UPI00029F36E0|nr:nuclear transport factor 2 family protein [Nostoc sp. PCC 7524]AFY50452.1 protein with protein kinase II-like association domain [Nostoc sp. PCC 7524]
MMQQRWANGYRCTQLLWSVLLVLAIWCLPQAALADNQQEINSILKTREVALEAINNRNFSKIQPYLHPSFTITTVDNQVFHKVPEFEKYWNQQFSSSIQNIKMNLPGETVRTFLSPETVVSSGEAISTFSFKDGKAADMAMRWTAVLQKLQDKWTIQSLHFSSNLLDNPVLSAAQGLGKTIGIASGVGGFLLGVVTMLIFRRQPSKEAKG